MNDIKDTERFTTERPNSTSKCRKFTKPKFPTDDGKIFRSCVNMLSSMIDLNRALNDAKYIRCGISMYLMISLMQSSFRASSMASNNVLFRFADVIKGHSEYHRFFIVTVLIDNPLISTSIACSKVSNIATPHTPSSVDSLSHHFSRPLFNSSSYNMDASSDYKMNSMN